MMGRVAGVDEVCDRGAVRLRRWCADDCAELGRVVRDCLPHLRPWLPWASGDYSDADAAEFLQQCETGWRRGTSWCFAITTGGAVVGGVGLEQYRGMRVLEIGYWLHPSCTGRGFASGAVSALLVQAWRLPGVQRVQIRHDANNAASSGVPRRLGFTRVDECDPPARGVGLSGVEFVWQLGRPSGCEVDGSRLQR